MDVFKPTLSRTDFRTAIEAGIVNAELSERASERLRELGETATEAVYGTFEDDTTGCKCPLLATGLVRLNSDASDIVPLLVGRDQIGRFYGGYDNRVREALRKRLRAAVYTPRTVRIDP